MVAAATAVPHLVEFATCWSCGQRIGIVTVKPSGRRRPVDPELRPLAEYALLRDGTTAVDLRHRLVDQDLADRHKGPCFWDHAKTCAVPGMVTARAVLQDRGGYRPDPERERARERLLKTGESPWVNRGPNRG